MTVLILQSKTHTVYILSRIYTYQRTVYNLYCSFDLPGNAFTLVIKTGMCGFQELALAASERTPTFKCHITDQ